MQAWWNKYKYQCKCIQDDFVLALGNILKYAAQHNFEEFFYTIKKYELDLNFLNPRDGKILLDFIKIEHDRVKEADPGYDRTKSLQDLYKRLRSYGALHKNEIK